MSSLAVASSAGSPAIICARAAFISARAAWSSAVRCEGRTKKAGSKKTVIGGNRHAMLSYQWDHQELVTKARQELTTSGVKCWMDIDGGMQRDIYDSMAEGVQGAAVVICFMSNAYQNSENCRLELKFAKQSGVPIVPVMLEDPANGWRATGWLGILTAGALWTPLHDDDKFQENCKNIQDNARIFQEDIL